MGLGHIGFGAAFLRQGGCGDLDNINRRVRLREPGFRLKTEGDTQGRQQIAALYAALAQDEQRNDLIFDDLLRWCSGAAGSRPMHRDVRA
jgi:hypothetical protein